MLPKTHIIIGFLVSLVLLVLIPKITIIGATIIFLSSFLIDIDHYMYYVLKQKDHNLKKAYYWFIQTGIDFKKLSKDSQAKYKRAIMIFHGMEFWLILILLIIFVNKVFLFVLIGISIHMTLDFMDLLKNNQPLHIKTSQVYTHLTNKKKVEFITKR
jgi:hypothetical protein